MRAPFTYGKSGACEAVRPGAATVLQFCLSHSGCRGRMPREGCRPGLDPRVIPNTAKAVRPSRRGMSGPLHVWEDWDT